MITNTKQCFIGSDVMILYYYHYHDQKSH